MVISVEWSKSSVNEIAKKNAKICIFKQCARSVPIMF